MGTKNYPCTVCPHNVGFTRTKHTHTHIHTQTHSWCFTHFHDNGPLWGALL